MTSRKSAKNSSAKNRRPVSQDPFLMGLPGLDFDGLSQDELLELTPEQAAHVFLSDWMTRFDPVIRYKRFFTVSEFGVDVTFRHVRQFYVTFVIDSQWSEEKYEMCLDSIFVQNKSLCYDVLEKQGELFERQELPMQLSARRAKRRGGRI